MIRLEGYENVPARMPRALAGRGLTARQRLRRSVGRTLAEAGYVEVLSSPFASRSDADLLGLPPEDMRRPAVVVANPLSEDEPLLRTTLLPGLFRVLARNIGRGFADTALFEIGLVFRPRPGAAAAAPILAVDRGPTVAELATLEAALPDQPQRLGAVLTGARELTAGGDRASGVVGGRDRGGPRGRADLPGAAGRPGRQATRPGTRGAARRSTRGWPRLRDGGQQREWLAGHAGELHPRVIQAFGLPDRTCAMELDLSVLFAAAESDRRRAGPAAVGLPAGHPGRGADRGRGRARRRGGGGAGGRRARGTCSRSVRLFDVYTGAQVGEDRKSLAYTLRFRAPDRTLTAAEATDARDAAVAEASAGSARSCAAADRVGGTALAPPCAWSVAKGGNCRSGCDYRRPQRSAEPEDDITRHAVARGGATEQAARTTFREVFAVAEFRALWLAQLLSVVGDQLARVALTVLVYDRTRSALLAAVTFVVSIVPTFIGGMTLAWLADRYPRRRVMIACDLIRAVLVLVMAIPGMPLAAMVALLFAVTLAGAPFTSARAAIFPDVLTGDRYVMGTAVTLTTYQFAQVIGFAGGRHDRRFLRHPDIAGHRRRDLRRVRAHRPRLGTVTPRRTRSARAPTPSRRGERPG